MALKTNALLTEAELEAFLAVAFETAYAEILIGIASDFIEKYCDRKFIEDTYTEEAYDGSIDQYLYLKNAPISAVTIQYWDTVNNVTSYTYSEFTDYVIYGTEGKIYMRGGWVYSPQIYRITYTAGYAIEDVPYDLKMVCAKLCETVVNGTGKSGISAEAMGKYSVTYDKTGMSVAGIPIPSGFINVLNLYKRYK